MISVRNFQQSFSKIHFPQFLQAELGLKASLCLLEEWWVASSSPSPLQMMASTVVFPKHVILDKALLSLGFFSVSLLTKSRTYSTVCPCSHSQYKLPDSFQSPNSLCFLLKWCAISQFCDFLYAGSLVWNALILSVWQIPICSAFLKDWPPWTFYSLKITY